MPTPTIPDGRLFMNATLWTGNGTTQNITNGVAGQSFQPDFLWVKERSEARSHWAWDVVRGSDLAVSPNNQVAELSEPSFTGFLSNGFGISNANTSDITNKSNQTYVGWQWKAGGTAVTNTAGTRTSQVSVNTTSGFSVVTFNSGSAGNQSFGHGLGVTPGFFVIKRTGGTSYWDVWHQSFSSPATNYMYLDLTNAVASDSRQWANTAPNSTVISYESGYEFAANSTFVAYCWAPIAGYSAMGSYTGNGSATAGPFVYLGFRPRFVMVKRTNSTGNWSITDTAINPYNNTTGALRPNTADSESTVGTVYVQPVSNGFYISNNNSDTNASGGTYIYMAFAENPFKYANAR